MSVGNRLVYVRWVDSCSSGGWETWDDWTDEALVCESVGWIAVDGAHVLVLVPHRHEENETIGTAESGCGVMHIPKSSVVDILPLETATTSADATQPTRPETTGVRQNELLDDVRGCVRSLHKILDHMDETLTEAIRTPPDSKEDES